MPACTLNAASELVHGPSTPGQSGTRGVWTASGRGFFATIVFTSALLLFLIQPILAKQLLPSLGGAASVWSASMAFFQVVLLLGYLYAHCSTRLLSRRTQFLTHTALLAASATALWLSPRAHNNSAVVGNPALVVIGTLTATIGLPYFVLSSTSPLLQAWYSARASQGLPYRLYALSNVGSLLALLAYPFIVEPALDIRVQFAIWRGLYLLFAVLCAAVAIRTIRAPVQCRSLSSRAEFHGTLTQKCTWIALAACSSAFLLAITNQLSQDVAPIPLMWIAPLAIYLVSFIICFDRGDRLGRATYQVFLPVALATIVYVQANPALGARIAVPLCLGGLVVVCMFCHGQLSKLKPETTGLTSFYVSISLGGALGGLFVGLLAPALFADFFELSLSVAICLGLALRLLFGYRSRTFLVTCVASTAVLLHVMSGLNTTGRTTYRARNFYGALTIREELTGHLGNVRTLAHGGTIHGNQALAPDMRREPRQYYARESGAGVALQRPGAGHEVGVVGLGVGTLAAYGRRGDHYRFYEINPLVIELARSRFSFLADSAAVVDVVLGDARLSLEKEPDSNFDTLVLDAFCGDSIPVHLLTREAFATYFRHLRPGGVIAVHISNRYLDLAPIVTGCAAVFGRPAVRVLSEARAGEAISAADWILVSTDRIFLSGVELNRLGHALLPGKGRFWTDHYSNILGLFR